MSKFNTYAKRLDTIAKEAFKEYREKEAAYKKAEQRAKEYPQRGGAVNAEYAAKAARAQADLYEARAAFEAARRTFLEKPGASIKAVRSELVAAVNDAFSVDPKQLDGNTLELLKSGIMDSGEYAKLLSEAAAAGNATMVRLIGKYANDAAAEVADKYGMNDRRAAELRAVSYQSRAYTGSVYVDNYDVITDIFNRCTNNPALIDKWDDLTREMVENF